MSVAIEVSGLSHRYPAVKAGREWALRDTNLAVGRGKVFALLGPNGAGKTTLVKIVSTLLIPTEGAVRVLGHDVVRDVKQVRETIGLVLGGERGLYDRLTAQDNLRYFAEMYGMGRSAGRARIDEVLAIVELTADRRKRVEQFSRGMKQRLHLARGIPHRPRVLLLDEPTIGVDPVGARQLRALVQHPNGQGTTVLLTTHYMHEAEQVAHDVATLREGRIAVRGPWRRYAGRPGCRASSRPRRTGSRPRSCPRSAGGRRSRASTCTRVGSALLIGTSQAEAEARALDHRLRTLGLHLFGLARRHARGRLHVVHGGRVRRAAVTWASSPRPRW